MIEIKSVTKKYGSFTAISDLSFTVPDASIYGLVGYNGAGKTSLLKTVAGVYKADGGEVLLDGENVYDNAKAKQRMFYVPDDLYFRAYTSMEKMASFYNNYYGRFSMETFEKLSEAFGLSRTGRLSGFSKGMQRQAELVFALATQPDYLLLDESFDGLDPQKRAIVKNMVKEYVADRGASIIISSHNLHDLGDLCDRFGLINGKKLVLDRLTADVNGNHIKFRMAFADDKSEADFEHIPHTKFAKDGRLIIFTVKGDSAETEEKIKAMNPLYYEQFPLTIEETFLEETEGIDYDFSKIFG